MQADSNKTHAESAYGLSACSYNMMNPLSNFAFDFILRRYSWGMFGGLGGVAACFAFGVSPSRSLRCAVSGAFGRNALVLDVEPVEPTGAAAAAEAAATAVAAAAAAAVEGGGRRGGGRGGAGWGLDGAAGALAAALAGAEARADLDGGASVDGGSDGDGEGGGGGGEGTEAVSIFPRAALPAGSALLVWRCRTTLQTQVETSWNQALETKL